jgi:cell division protein FtsI/penicillin-binding protein 2
MAIRATSQLSERQKKASLARRITFVYGFLGVCTLLIIARLIELQVVRGQEYREAAEERHSRTIVVPAKRGEVLGINSKTGETTMYATNTTLDLLYVDPLVANSPTFIADTLSTILLTPEFHTLCSKGNEACPRELMTNELYAQAFDPILLHALADTGAILDPLALIEPKKEMNLPDLGEARRRFARSIERRITEKRVTFAPLKYGATKVQLETVRSLTIPGVTVLDDTKLIYANPEQVNQSSILATSQRLAKALGEDAESIHSLMRSRPLRYVPIMRKLPPPISLAVKEAQLASLKEAITKQEATYRGVNTQTLDYPLKGIALIPEHWRFYPDTTVGSHVVGFVNSEQIPQYGIERTFDPQLRGQEGVISTINDLRGGQILTSDQTIVNPKDGDTIVLTIDRSIQKQFEQYLATAVEKYEADSGQGIVMDPYTGRILAMANAPLFDGNDYAHVYEKEVLKLDPGEEKKIVVELFDPTSNARIVKAYKDDVFTASGRTVLTPKTLKTIIELEKLYDLKDLTRYYWYLSDTIRREIFPTDKPGTWLKFKNDLGVGAYLNRTIQEIYEPGSVMKPLTMAIAIDQGELTPDDTYDDLGPVKIDEFEIKNSLLKYYGKVTMTECLEFSINTCMTSVSFKLGIKLFHHFLEKFGFGRITGIELEDELTGDLPPWRDWGRAHLATIAYGQGISTTPLQVITAWAALANGGKIMRPTIIHEVRHADGTVDRTEPKIVEQVISTQTADTIKSMLVRSAEEGFAKAGRLPNHYVAGKTGTSQIAGPGGKYETGTGSTIASFAGFAPISKPKFLMLIKIDRPKNVIHGATAAAPVFKQMAEFLFEYYGIPPDKK